MDNSNFSKYYEFKSPVDFTHINLPKLCNKGIDCGVRRYYDQCYKIIIHVNNVTQEKQKILTKFFQETITPILSQLPENNYKKGIKANGSPNPCVLFQWDILIYPFVLDRAKEILDLIIRLLVKQFS